MSAQQKYTPRLLKDYRARVVPELKKEFSYKNAHQVPKMEKIVISFTSKDVVANAKVLDKVSEELALITGQKPMVTRSKKSIAGFKLREGIPLGLKVTLRNKRMYDFFDRFVSIALPRMKDFKGCDPDGFDGRGTYNMGIKEQIVFPEVNYDRVDKIRGMNITIVTSAKNNIEARSLLKAFGFPFRGK